MADLLAVRRNPRAQSSDEEVADSLDARTREVYARADRAAAVNSAVLITGESGTGKEVLARRIHRRSVRARGKFVSVNCGSLPESLIETELFGFKKGAFTGAYIDKKGLVEEAEGGVLFLDEIGDMPLVMQIRLLRFLDRGELRAVGGTTVRIVDVRVIAATHQCLQTQVREKRFREDLYFRLSVVPLHLPPLRERRADLPALAEHHVRQAAKRLGVPPPVLAGEALEVIACYEWPGNIRELQNVLECALVLGDGELITARDIVAALPRPVRTVSAAPSEVRDATADLLAALQRCNGNHRDAAAALGISRTTLWRRLRESRATRMLEAAAGAHPH